MNEKDSDDSEEDVPIQGPTFKFDKPIQDNVFKLQVTPKTNNEVDKSSEKANSGSTQSSSQVTYGSNKQPTSSVLVLYQILGLALLPSQRKQTRQVIKRRK